MTKSIKYLNGFGNHFASEAKAGALPVGQNSPQKVNFGLYAEQLSGTAFTKPSHLNQRSWLYRILPSVKHGEFSPLAHNHFNDTLNHKRLGPPNQMRWDPLPFSNTKLDLIQSLIVYASNGMPQMQRGSNVMLYTAQESMHDCYFYNADGDMLFVPQEGELLFHTEFGLLEVVPKEIMVIPRGIKFRIELLTSKARGYVLENFGQHFRLPERGVIGANGLANERDFLVPTAHYEHIQGNFKLICKFQNHLWQAEIFHSPLDVVAWHGNYTPYKYDLTRFNTMNTVSYDHADPSIFTVLTSPSDIQGVANIDFVIFPERWAVAEHSFRPPYYHRNIMSEFMGLVQGVYDAKEKGFLPGGASLHNCMSAHGPDKQAFDKASKETLKPVYHQGILAFMFESRYPWSPTQFALSTSLLQKDYMKCWQDLTDNFSDD